MKGPRWLCYHFCRLALGGVFVYAGFLKAQDVHAFAGSVAAYQVLPYTLNYLVAATLPWLELLVGGLLLVNRHVRAAALVAGGLTAFFVVVLVSVLLRGLDIDCGCFGAAATATPLQALGRDVVLLFLAHTVFHLRPAMVRGAVP